MGSGADGPVRRGGITTSGAKKIILLVEDEAVTALAESRALEKYGYEVVVAGSGESAVALAEGGRAIDLVLMDINLGPGIDGTEAAERILAVREVPVLFLSSHSEREIVERTERISSYGYVVKSSATTVLDASIKMAFKLFDAHREIRTGAARLHEKNQLLESLMERFPGSVFWKNLDLVYLGCNTAEANSSGAASPAEVVGKTDYELGWTDHPPEFYRDSDRRVIETGRPLMHVEYSYHMGNGELVWVDTSKVPIFDAEGKVSGVFGVAVDVTARKRYEEALRESEARLSRAEELARIGNMRFSLGSDAAALSSGARAILGIGDREFSRGLFESLLLHDIRPELAARHAELVKRGLPYQAELRLKRPEDGRVVEVLVIAERVSAPEGDSVYVVLQDVTEKKRFEASLRDANDLLSQFVSRSPIFAYIKEASPTDSRLLYASDTYKDFSDLLRPDYLGRSMRELFPPDRAEQYIQEDWKVASEGAVLELEAEHLGRHFITIKFPLRHGDRTLVGCYSIEITEAKRAEALIRMERNRLQNVLAGTKAGTWTWNVQTGEADIDEASAAMLGYSSAELDPDPFEAWMSLKHPDDRGLARELLQRHVRGETEAYSHESRMRHRDGRWIWIHARGKVIEWDGEGKPRIMYGTYVDVTERKRAEALLKESEERYKLATEITLDYVYTIGVSQDGRLSLDYVSEPFERITGRSQGAMRSLESWRGIFHPDDLGRVDDFIRGLLASPRVAELECRTYVRDGRLRWISITSRSIWDGAAGRVTSIVGAVRDVTERKASEDRINALLAEKELVLKEVHHRIKNNMSTMMSLLTLQRERLSDPAAVAALEDAGRRLSGMSLLYDRLYRSENRRDIPAADYLAPLAKEIVRLFPNGEAVRVEARIEDFVLGSPVLSSLGIIVNELVSNAMKHAFVGRGGGLVSIAASRRGGRVSLVVGDDGVGLPADVDVSRSSGFGLFLVGALAAQLGASISVERGGGTRFVLEFEG